MNEESRNIMETEEYDDEIIEDSEIDNAYDADELFEVGNAYKLYMSSLPQLPLLTREEEVNLAMKIQEGDTEALNTLVTRNLRLPVVIAKKYSGKCKSLDLMDLISEGNIGLTIAAQKYDPSKSKFSNYAVYWIKQCILRAIYCQDGMIQFPVNLTMKTHRIIKDTAIKSVHETNQTLSEQQVDTIIRNYAKNEDEYDRLKDVLNMRSVGSLSLPIMKNEDTMVELIDLIPGEEDVEGTAVDNLAGVQLDEYMHKMLKPQEYDIIRRRFGFINGEIYTLEALGNEYNLTKERIRQIEKKALGKLAAIAM